MPLAGASRPRNSDQVRPPLVRRDLRRGERRHRVGHADRVRRRRHAAHPGAQRLRTGNRIADAFASRRAHQRAAMRLLEARAVQLQHERRARGEGRGHERGVARRIAARAEVQVHQRAAVAGEQQAEPPHARRARGRALRCAPRVAVRRQVVDRPALEQAVGAVGVDHGGDAAARLGRGAEHDQSGIGIHGMARSIIGSRHDGAASPARRNGSNAPPARERVDHGQARRRGSRYACRAGRCRPPARCAPPGARRRSPGSGAARG